MKRWWSCYIIFHSLICCPRLSCRSWFSCNFPYSLWKIQTASLSCVHFTFCVRVISYFHVQFALHRINLFGSLSLSSFLSLSFDGWFFFLGFSFSCSLDFHKGNIIDSKPSTALNITFVANFMRTKRRTEKKHLWLPNGTKISTDWMCALQCHWAKTIFRFFTQKSFSLKV